MDDINTITVKEGVRRARVLRQAIEAYGEDHQTLKAIEEMAELTKALIKLKDCETEADRQVVKDAIDEEMADVSIMLQQLYMIYNNFDRVERVKQKKVDRLERRLKAINGGEI